MFLLPVLASPSHLSFSLSFPNCKHPPLRRKSEDKKKSACEGATQCQAHSKCLINHGIILPMFRSWLLAFLPQQTTVLKGMGSHRH